jgi:hypothetical protein
VGLTIGQQQVLTVPSLADTVPIFHQANDEGYQVSLQTLQALIGGGGGIPSITFNTNLSPLTVYNYGNYVNTAPVGGGSAAVNTAALVSMFTAMDNAAGMGGGWAWIPQYNFSVTANSTGPGIIVPPGPTGQGLGGCILQGLGSGGSKGTAGSVGTYHFIINDDTSGFANTFLNCSGAHTSGGSYFNNLSFRWQNPGYALDTCLYLNFWGNVVADCTFTDCPVAMNIQGLGIQIRHCVITYGDYNINTGPFNTTAILMTAINSEIIGPSEFNGQNVGPNAFTTGTSTCIAIGGGLANCNINRFRNLHVVDWCYGIDYGDINASGIGSSTQFNVIEDCHFECIRTCVYLKPNSSSGQIYDQKFANNTFIKGQNSMAGDPVVLIDSNTGTNQNIGPIMMVDNFIYSNCTSSGGHTGVAQNNQYGIQIGNAHFVTITGGQISQMGNANNLGSDNSANICISGNPDAVVIQGVNLSGTYYGVNNGGSTGANGSGASMYSLLISGSPGSVRVSNCTMGGTTGASPISVTGSTSLIVTNCINYNDQNTVVTTLGSLNPGTPYSASQNGSTNKYYGPSFVMFTQSASGGTFQVNGGTAQTPAASQVVTLYLGSPYDTITFNTHLPSALQWIGK